MPSFTIPQSVLEAYKTAHSYANGNPIPNTGSPQQIAQWAVDQQMISQTQANDYLAGQGITGNVIQTGTNGAGVLVSTGSNDSGSMFTTLGSTFPATTTTAPTTTGGPAQTGTILTVPPLPQATQGTGATGASSSLPTYAQLMTAFQQQFGRGPSSGDEFNQWAAARGTPQWVDSPAGTTTGTQGAGTAGAGGTGNTIVDTPQGTFRDLGNEAANTLAAQIGMSQQQFDAYAKLLPQYSQTELTNLRNTLFGSVDAGQFLQAHPEFQQGYDNARAAGQDPQQWLNQAVGSSTYLDQGNIARGGGLFDINKALTTEANNQTIASNTALRNANLADASALGGNALSLLQSLNPNQYASLNQAQQAAGAGIQPSQYESQLGQNFSQGASFTPVVPETSLLGMDLTKMARDQLALGGQATPWELQQAEQAAREAWSARGLINSPGAVGAEIINRDDLQRQRLLERQQFAGGVEQLGLAQRGLTQQAGIANQQAGLSAQQQNNALGLSLLGADLNRQQQNFGNIMSNAQLQGASAFNPFGTITGWGTANQGVNTSIYGMGGNVTSGATGNQSVQNMFDPFSAYASNLYGQNYGAYNNAVSSANDVSSGKAAGWGSLIGSVAGSLFGPAGTAIGGAIGNKVGGLFG